SDDRLVVQDFIPAQYRVKKEYSHLRSGHGPLDGDSMVRYNEAFEEFFYASIHSVANVAEWSFVKDDPRHEQINDPYLEDKEHRHYYLFEGVFCRGSGAERLRVIKI